MIPKGSRCNFMRNFRQNAEQNRVRAGECSILLGSHTRKDFQLRASCMCEAGWEGGLLKYAHIPHTCADNGLEMNISSLQGFKIFCFLHSSGG